MSENLIGASQGQMNNLNGYMGDLPQVLPASAEQFPGKWKISQWNPLLCQKPYCCWFWFQWTSV